MSKKDVLLIANYWHMESEKASSRYRTFADILSTRYDLEVVTSTFCHLKKEQRKIEKLYLDELPYKMTFCYEKGYDKNISLKRIRSYKEFGKNVYEYLKTRKKADVVIVSVPSLSVADYVTKFCQKNNIPVIVDIQDLWPEAFKMAIKMPVVSDVLFAPMMRQANRTYARANVIMAVSDTYVARGKKCNPNAEELSIYIGTDEELVEKKTKGVVVDKPKDEFWVGYVGALGHSYDIKLVIDGIKRLKEEKGIDNIVFKIMGDGVLRQEFEEYARNSGIRYEFTGLLEYGVMMKTLMSCDVGVNAIIGTSVSSIINKVADYAAAGVPVINTQNCEEYRQLLVEYNCGISITSGDVHEFANALWELYGNENKRLEMNKNARRLYDDKFNRRKRYPKLMNMIDSLLK